MSISADEVNYLIYRYLQENGFSHTAFTFAYESLVAKSAVAYTDVPPGALITFLQKGLEYVAIEEHIDEDGTIAEFDSSATSLLSPFICNAVATKEDRRPRKEKPHADAGSETAGSSSSSHSNTMDVQGNDGSGTGSSEDTGESRANNYNNGNGNGNSTAPGPCAVTVKSEVGNKKWLYLSGHQAEVFTCSWNPVEKQMASGSADGVCRLWSLTGLQKENWDEVDSQVAIRSSILVHTQYPGERFKDITVASWSPCGKFLATGCYDGLVRVWDAQGNTRHVLTEHQGPVFSVEWSKSGTHILTAGHDARVIVWNSATGAIVKVIKMHSLPVMDVDWKDNDIFATCSSDKTIVLGSISGADGKALLGHQSEVNVVRWSPDGNYLASCSDDFTAKIWTVKDGLIQDLTGHTKEVYSMRWVPLSNANKPLILCTSSFDGTAKIWNAIQGTCMHTLSRHQQALYSIAPSPSGEFVATGALGGYVSIWKIADGSLHKEFRGTGDTYDVSWSADSTLLSSCFSSGTIKIVDPSM